jgi:hypothetical protein
MLAFFVDFFYYQVEKDSPLFLVTKNILSLMGIEICELHFLHRML